jgi:predicted RNA-binding protein with PIN domain
MPDPTLYLFDGYNLLHAGEFRDVPALTNALASFVSLRGARGIVVFDGVGSDRVVGDLTVRYVPHADSLLERLAAEHRAGERVCLVSSDAAVRGTSGQEVAKLSSQAFAEELSATTPVPKVRSPLADRLDAATRARLERWRRAR